MHPFLDLPPSLGDAILSLQPTAYWPLDDGGSPLRSLAQNWPATVTGSPTYGVAAPIGRGITWSGSGQYATTSGSVPTPSASVSVLAVYATTDATAAARVMVSRAGANQHSWDLRLASTHTTSFFTKQADGTTHATAQVAGATNDGNPHVVVGTFDGTTIRCGRDDVAAATSTSLTGSWHKASTAGICIAHVGGSLLYPGTLFLCAYWADRVITDAERLWVYSIVKGG